MGYCVNCGQKLSNESKFCPNCGTPRQADHSPKSGSDVGKREEVGKTVYEGTIHKCPNCGIAITGFATVCSACGYEFRDGKAAESVKEFAYKLAESPNGNYTVSLIRNFPIPNTKEDILEFSILATTNIRNETNPHIRLAWQTKLEQVYKKAQLVLDDEDALRQVEEMYEGATLYGNERHTTNDNGHIPSAVTDKPKNNSWVSVFLWIVVWIIAFGACGAATDLKYTPNQRLGYTLLMLVLFIAYGVHLFASRPRLVEYILSGFFIVGILNLYFRNTEGYNGGHLITAILSAILVVSGIIKRARQNRGYTS